MYKTPSQNLEKFRNISTLSPDALHKCTFSTDGTFMPGYACLVLDDTTHIFVVSQHTVSSYSPLFNIKILLESSVSFPP